MEGILRSRSPLPSCVKLTAKTAYGIEHGNSVSPSLGFFILKNKSEAVGWEMAHPVHKMPAVQAWWPESEIHSPHLNKTTGWGSQTMRCWADRVRRTSGMVCWILAESVSQVQGGTLTHKTGRRVTERDTSGLHTHVHTYVYTPTQVRWEKKVV